MNIFLRLEIKPALRYLCGLLAAIALSANVSFSAVQHVVDMNGDGATDWSIVRNTGGGPSGLITWFTWYNGLNEDQINKLGIATDFFLPGDYDGDGKTDPAVWRQGSPGAWYVLRSSDLTIHGENFGQTGDDPTVFGDYDADGKDDIAVYRAGATAGAPSFWFWRQSLNQTYQSVQWGQNGDFPAPGDYDGDGKNDFAIQRNAGGGQARFWILTALGGMSTTVFGTPTDVIVPGDYDGDDKTDIALLRGVSGQIYWFVLPSGGGPYTQTVFGNSASDFSVQGDYDDDGITDIAVWRPELNPNLTYFYVNKSTGGLLTYKWGQNGDYPVANYNSH